MDADGRMECLSQRLQRILAILAEGRLSLDTPEATQWKALTLARWQLRHALSDFVRFKQTYLLAPILTADEPALAARAAAIATRNTALDESYRAFVEHWTLQSPLSVDEAYRAEAKRMSQRIECEVIADVQELDSLIRRASGRTGPLQ